MAVYSFFCEDNHETERFCRLENRPESIECRKCGKDAVYRPTVSKHQGLTPPEPEKAPASKFNGLSLHSFYCEECGESFDDFIDHALDEKPSDGKECPKCKELARWNPSTMIDRFSERFPYYDRGLGMWIKSKQHRKDVCKNPRRYGIDSDGLEPVDGDWDVDRYVNDLERKDDELLKGYDEYVDKLENHPAFSSYRKARDQGRVC